MQRYMTIIGIARLERIPANAAHEWPIIAMELHVILK